MKMILVLLSLAFLPLSTLSTNTPNQAFLTIFDTDGNPLNKSSRYFIVSAIVSAISGGGVMPANLENQEQNLCPTSVVQSKSGMDDGKAVYFIPNDHEEEIIREMSTLNIKFYEDSPTCYYYSMWKVDNFPKPAEQYNISTGLIPLINSMRGNNRFQIKSLGGRVYKLMFCPFEEINCLNVGIADERNGYNRLVVTELAKAFVFKYDKYFGKEIM